MATRLQTLPPLFFLEVLVRSARNLTVSCALPHAQSNYPHCEKKVAFGGTVQSYTDLKFHFASWMDFYTTIIIGWNLNCDSVKGP